MAEQRAQLKPRPNCSRRNRRSSRPGTRENSISQKVRRAGGSEIDTQEAPRSTSTNNRPTSPPPTDAPRSRYAPTWSGMRAVRRVARGPALPRTFRRGSVVGSPPNRENQCGTRFQRWLLLPPRAFRRRGHDSSRLNYRLLLELGGLGHRGSDADQRCMDCLQRLRPFQLPARRVSPPPTWTMAPHPRTCHSSNGHGCRIGAFPGRRRWTDRSGCEGKWLTLDERTDADHSHGQRRRGVRHATCRRGPRRIPRGNLDDYNLHCGRLGNLRHLVHRPGLWRDSAAYPLRLRDRPEIRVDGARLVDTGSIDAEACQHLRHRIRRQLEERLHAGRTLLVRRRARATPRSTIRTSPGTTFKAAGCSRANAAATTRPRDPSRIRAPRRRCPGRRPWRLRTRRALQPHEPEFRGRHRGHRGRAGSIRGGDQSIVTLGSTGSRTRTSR